MKRLRHIATFFFLGVQCVFAQSPNEWKTVGKEEVTKVFKQLNDRLQNTSSYSLTVTHTSYENYTTPIPVEKTQGYFKKNKNNYHSYLVGIHTLQNNKYKVVIDSAEKIIAVANPDKDVWTALAPNDYAFMLNLCASIKMYEKGKDKNYRLEFFEGYSIAYYDMTIGAEGLLKEIIIYYRNEESTNEEGETRIEKPRLSIAFSGYDMQIKSSMKNEFDENRYVFLKDKKLHLTNAYKNYQLNDQRLYLEP